MIDYQVGRAAPSGDNCTIAIRVSAGMTMRTVVTHVTPTMIVIPFPPGSWFNVAALATIFNVPIAHMYVILHRHKAHLTPAVYRPKSPRKRYRERIVSEADYNYLRTLFPVYMRKT